MFLFLQNAYNGQQSWYSQSDNYSGALPSHPANQMHGQQYYNSPERLSHSTPSGMTREQFLSHSTPAGMTREEFFRQSRGGVVQNDYIRYGYGSKPVEVPDEPPVMVEDDRYITNVHAR